MNKHTPGPWVIKRSGVISQKETGKVIATCGYNVSVGSTEDDDNVRLIAAAPDLLEALNLINVDSDGDGFICSEAMDQVRAAIAKATGQSS